jgi:hypothetical protein
LQTFCKPNSETTPAQQVVQPVGSLGLEVGEDVAIKVEGDGHASVAQPLGDYLRVNPLLKQEGGVGVAKVVEAQAAKAHLSATPQASTRLLIPPVSRGHTAGADNMWYQN